MVKEATSRNEGVWDLSHLSFVSLTGFQLTTSFIRIFLDLLPRHEFPLYSIPF